MSAFTLTSPSTGPTAQCCAPTNSPSRTSVLSATVPGGHLAADVDARSTQSLPKLAIPTHPTTTLSSTENKALEAPSSTASASPSHSLPMRPRDVSNQAIFEGLPSSPSDTFFTSPSSSELGLGLIVRSPSPRGTTTLRTLLSPLACRRSSPIHGVPFHRMPPTRLLLSATLMVRATGAGAAPQRQHSQLSPHSPPPAPAPVPTAKPKPESRYAGLGHGLPSHMRSSSRYAAADALRAISGLTITSCRAVSHVLQASGSYQAQEQDGKAFGSACGGRLLGGLNLLERTECAVDTIIVLFLTPSNRRGSLNPHSNTLLQFNYIRAFSTCSPSSQCCSWVVPSTNTVAQFLASLLGLNIAPLDVDVGLISPPSSSEEITVGIRPSDRRVQCPRPGLGRVSHLDAYCVHTTASEIHAVYKPCTRNPTIA
ncbi:hypothetical protein C8R46DRAFT_1203760, partial [Mycena filopes]